jgi:hypothetical protein
LFELGHVEEAIGWCERTLELARRIDSPLVIANVNQTLARIAASRDDYPAAARYADDAAATFDAAGLTPEAAECRKLAEDYRAAN